MKLQERVGGGAGAGSVASLCENTSADHGNSQRLFAESNDSICPYR